MNKPQGLLENGKRASQRCVEFTVGDRGAGGRPPAGACGATRVVAPPNSGQISESPQSAVSPARPAGRSRYVVCYFMTSFAERTNAIVNSNVL
ncbi:hypothetical protein EVAR_11993_1 [Eumeta japonica]|uniref:Uncharacterized protein n=1 Tax=Eumeta variegata TaxID=151549 RepID=A0A4C1U4X1_EUMVA|nr:hypothetical protein EVAR_11993_1 [Eumeta japonica]